MKKKSKKNLASAKNIKPETIYLHNTSGVIVAINGKVVEPDDAISLPVEMEKEAREKGLD